MASPIELTVILYDGALSAVKDARGYLKSGQILLRGEAISKAVGVLAELLMSLDRERGGQLAERLSGLYAYMQTRLETAHFTRSGEPLAEVQSLLSPLAEAWREAARQLSQPQSSELDDCLARIS